MNKLLLCLTAVTCFSLLNVATADSLSDCMRMKDDKPIEAIPFCKEACNQNEAAGCSVVGIIYIKTAKNSQDILKAVPYNEKACNLNEPAACYNLGLIYTGKKEYEKADKSYEKACNLNLGKGCLKLGNDYLLTDSRKSLPYSEKACNMNEAEGCFNVAWIYEKGQRVRQSFQKAKEYYGKSCDLGYAHGCSEYRRLNEKGY